MLSKTFYKIQKLFYFCHHENKEKIHAKDQDQRTNILSSSRTSVRVKLGLFNAKIRNENRRYIHRLIQVRELP